MSLTARLQQEKVNS